MTTRSAILACAALFWSAAAPAQTVDNPDQITTYFPAFEGDGNLGRNVATVLSLQLAQTTRRAPWPDNPQGHDFGEGMIRWSEETLEDPSHEAAQTAAQSVRLLAQMVVWGRVHRYADDVIADINVTLPRFASPQLGACRDQSDPCDYRQKNFERWLLDTDAGPLAVDMPSRRFTFSAVRLREDVVNEYRSAEGLQIQERRDGGRVLGITGPDLRFIEFNKAMEGAPTKLRSNGVTGYVRMPELSEAVSEYADMIGGVMQIFRGDWQAAESSFARVVEYPSTRAPLRIDAMMLGGMAHIRGGGQDLTLLRRAVELAPLDKRAVQYLVMALMKLDSRNSRAEAQTVLRNKAHLFDPQDPWLEKANAASGG